jgi:hypothetical protein
VALRFNSDLIKWEEKGGRIIKEKVPAAPGNKWVGLVLLFSAETGEPLAIFPDGIIQGIRVAASSGLAVRLLARQDTAVLGILGRLVGACSRQSDVCRSRHSENSGSKPYEKRIARILPPK